MSNFLEQIHVKCAVSCQWAFPQTGVQGLFGLRNLMKSHLTINVQLRSMRLHCLACSLRQSQAYNFGEQFYCNEGLHWRADRDLGVRHIPNVQERVQALPRAVSFFQYPLGGRAHSIARFGWC